MSDFAQFQIPYDAISLFLTLSILSYSPWTDNLHKFGF